MALNTSDLLASVPTGLLINGHWVDAATSATFTVENPATGESLAEVAAGSAEDAARALDAAANAQKEWARTSARERSDILRRAFDLVHERAEEFATLMTLEMGKSLAEARGEVAYGAEFLRWFSEEAVRHYGHSLTSPEGKLNIRTQHKPVGPCLLITPWNFPLAMATRKVAPAVAAGCTMVLKPAELTPLTSLYFAQTMLDAGLPAGVLNVVTTLEAPEVSQTLMSDDRLRKVSFTGSTGVGKILLRQASDNVLRTSMERGGNAPLIVFEDADLDIAVEQAKQAKMRNMGEACTAANRMIVHEAVFEEFSRRLTAELEGLKVGNGMDESTDVGPLIEQKALDNVASLVEDAVSKGAKVLTGGEKVGDAGYFYAPTVLAEVPADARIATEEIFGPVAPIFTFSTEEEAYEIANGTEYGLASYVFTDDAVRMQRATENLEFGMVGVNVGVMSNAAAPFGGVKQSGLGREGGAEGIEEYSSVQYVATPR